MPSITVSFSQAGPLVQAAVGVSVPHRDALLAANKPVPNAVQGTFLIDTGASGTCVDPGLVAPLGLTPTGAVMMQTPSTGGTPFSCYQYDVMILIPGRQNDPPFFILGGHGNPTAVARN
jgi:Aspartyl protease